MSHFYKCDNCGDEVREPEATGEWDCVVCGERMKEQEVSHD